MSTPRYVIKGAKPKTEAICKLSIRKVPIDQLEKEIENLFALAAKDKKNIQHVRGTLTCY